MHVSQNRPRDLHWRHSGPLLFGDWGTSRLYVLGLAFYYTGHASITYMVVMSLIMAAVAWAYTIVCRCFPEGGGVYAAARQVHPTLAVIGGTLLLCDFIVTASLSAVEAFHYLGVPSALVVWLSSGTIALLGVVNWYGARSAGRFALVIAVVAIGVSAGIGLMCLPMLPEGWAAARVSSPGLESHLVKWESLVRIVLALSGVEAVANMTGLMKKPVERTAKLTIWPVLGEVLLLNMIFVVAMNALPQLSMVTTPDYIVHEVIGGAAPENVPPEVKEYRDTALKVLAVEAGGRLLGGGFGGVMGTVSGVVFGLLLLSAVNTVIMAMVSVMYSMAQDRELPRALARLNYTGVPWIGLVLACVLPAVVLCFVSDTKALGELYAIGVVGAIMINVASCAWNTRLPIGVWERRGLWALAALMAVIEATIIVAKPQATLFAGVVIGTVLAVRAGVRALMPREPLPEPAAGWMSEIGALPLIVPGRPRIMLAARGRDNAEYAVDLARRRGGVLFTIFVRVLRVMDVGPENLPRVEEDPEAQAALGTVVLLAKQAGVPCYPIYVTSADIAGEILDYTVTFGCGTLILGQSKRSLFSRRVAGDVVAEVARHLPEGVALRVRAGRPDADGPRGESAGNGHAN
ncbi:MAG: universal stress protein [Phycisphaeraceae bacterium]|nr:universal stress protein [Phycisphaeraceae bacterium]